MSSFTGSRDDLRTFSKSEVAERLGISERQVDRLLDRGQLRSVFTRGRGVPVRIPAASLRAFLDGA